MTEPDREIEASWRRNADAWTSAVRAHTLESRRLVTDRAVVDAVLALAGSRILDVGCGEGWLARRLAGSDREVVGFDGSPELIAHARAAGGAAFFELSYEAFVHEPQHVGSDFDVAVCNFSLLGEHVARVLRAVLRVTAPSGRLVVQTVHPATDASAGSYADGWREERFEPLPGTWQPMPWYFRTFGSWIRVLRAAGWQVETVTEPVNPHTGTPASLLLIAAPIPPSDRASMRSPR